MMLTYGRIVTLIVLLALGAPTISAAENAAARSRTFRESILPLSQGGEIRLQSPARWDAVAEIALATVRTTYQDYAQQFGEIPPFRVTIRILPDSQFFKETGAPPWTNALYYKKQIYIPLSETSAPDLLDLTRSVRHEFTHAIIHALSNGRCPGWLDEGIAQWSEGTPSPALSQALDRWLRRNSPVPLGLLQGGFTKLNSEMVPAAYAQSFYAARMMVDLYGLPTIADYLRGLQKDGEVEDVFKNTFALNEHQFEQGLTRSLKVWQVEGATFNKQSEASYVLRKTSDVKRNT
jgi:hypothetical protein